MPAFVDTTVLIDVAVGKEPTTSSTKSLAGTHGPLEVPDYAFRELLAGRVQLLADAHNRVLAAGDPAEAITSVLRMTGFRARTAASTATAISNALSTALRPRGTRDVADVKREVLQSLMLEVSRLWRNANRTQLLSRVQPLSCIAAGSIELDPSTKALRGPANRFNCVRDQKCGAAAYMHNKPQDIVRLIAALHPKQLAPDLAAKRENQSRRAALKDLQSRGPAGFRKGYYCRALGDAYFALMAPPGAFVLTTNLSDHQLLCEALNKVARAP